MDEVGSEDREALTIKVRAGGPYRVSDTVRLLDDDGNEIPIPASQRKGGTIVLCRCGRSADKPFCDRSHREADFDS